VAAIVVHIIVSSLVFDPTLGWQRGNYSFMVLAEALRSGAGYRDLFLVGAPFHTATPPAYPSLLALLSLAGGVGVYKLASLAMTTGSVALAYALGRHYLPRRTAALAATIVGVSPSLLAASHSVLPAAQLLVLVLLALWSAAEASRWDPVRGGAGRAWMEALVIGSTTLAFLTHEQAFPLLIATPVYFLTRGRRRTAAAATASAFAVAVLWAVYQLRAAPGSESYLANVLFLGSELPDGERVGAAEALAAAARTAWARTSGLLAAYMGEFTMLAMASARYLLGSLLAVGLALFGWAQASSGRRAGLAEIFAFCYACFAIIGPPAPSTAANLLPIIPLLAIYALAAARALAAFPARRHGTRPRWPAVASAIPVAVAIVFTVPALVDSARLAPDRVACLRSFGSGVPCERDGVAAFREVADWARERTPPTAIVISRQPSMFYWFSGRRGAVYRRSSEPSLVLDALDAVGADFLVIDRLDITTTRYLAPVVRQSPARFRWVLSEGQPPTLLLEIEPPDVMVLAARSEMPD
jgi:hypothetical protein